MLNKLDHVSVSLICMDLINVEREVDFLMEQGINQFHADFMDNNFVPRLGISPELIQRLKLRYKDDIIIDSHLMVQDPESILKRIIPSSDWVFFHYESQQDPLRVSQKAYSLSTTYDKNNVGISFNPMTPIPDNRYWPGYIKGIMLMGISPGVLGSETYTSMVLDKIETLHERSSIFHLFNDYHIFIDGAVDFDTIKEYKNKISLIDECSGYTFICGSHTIFEGVGYNEFRNDKIIENIKRLRECIEQ